MSLDKEWKSRLELWMEELRNHFYRELGEIDFEGYATKERLALRAALEGPFRPMPPGSRWGAKWEYGWFRGGVALPPEAEGRRIVIRPETGGESAIFINGTIAGAIDRQHQEVTLCRRGVPGRVYGIAAESYAGHGPRVEHAGPTPPGRQTVPEPEAAQAAVGRSTFGIWEEDAYQLWMDVSTLYQVRCGGNENSLRVAQIDEALKDFTLLVDFEGSYEERLESFRAGRGRLRPLLLCVNGSTAPTMYIFGQSHLDLAWLWPIAETERKCARTLSTQLALMKEYPGYKFLLCQPPLYEMLKEHYPELYGRVRKKVESGRIIPEGGMWVEPDTNLPSGESLIRQLLYGKRFYREECAVESELLWLPDVFGFTAALPQIMKGCGIKYFCTKKIVDNYHGGDPFPYNIFLWEGIDGTRVLSHIIRKSNAPIEPLTLIRRWEYDRRQKDRISTFLFPFGYGDGGGGAVRDHLEYVKRLGDLEGVPRTRMCHPREFFRDLEEKGPPENVYAGELYFQAHRGTYTSQAKMKKWNRRCEFALREAELWGAAAGTGAGFPYPKEELEELWKLVLFNQFHDIITGASIQRVHEEAEENYLKALRGAENIKISAALRLVGSGDGIAVFNSLSWDRTELIALPPGLRAVACTEGKAAPVQLINGRAFAEVRVPSCGWTTLKEGRAPETIPNTLRVHEKLLENECLRVEFNDFGEITGIYDRESGFELAAGPCNSFRLYRDVPSRYDAWDIDSMYDKLPVELRDRASMEVICAGPLLAGIRIKRRINASFLTQEVYLRRGGRRVEFRTRIDWREDHKLLKVEFPVELYSGEAVQEIQFGHIKRPNHKSRQYDADRFEVCNHKWTAIAESGRGFAVLNDCKYGVSVHGGNISLTLLKSALAPDMRADRGVQEFTYALYAWNGPFVKSGVVREAYELNSPVFSIEGGGGKQSLFSVDAENIIIETVKAAEDQSGDVVLRLYESMGVRTRCTLNTALPAGGAQQTNMLEDAEKELLIRAGKIETDFRPFEVKTIRLAL